MEEMESVFVNASAVVTDSIVEEEQEKIAEKEQSALQDAINDSKMFLEEQGYNVEEIKHTTLKNDENIVLNTENTQTFEINTKE